MSIRKLRVYEQGASTYVIGTDDINTALTTLGISPNTHRWGGTEWGQYVRRKGQWRSASENWPPKDARLGVVFYGRIHRDGGGT